jgi:hypothetical protein
MAGGNGMKVSKSLYLSVDEYLRSASTGTDPQPYFRIFNPYNQSEKVRMHTND